MSPATTAAMSEWLSEMERLSRGPKDDGHSAKELVVLFGVSYQTVMKRLHVLNDAGMLKVGQRRMMKLNGRADVLTVYQLVKKRK